MTSAFTASCLLCSREVAHVVGGRLLGRPRLVRDGRRVRCGHCRGSVVVLPDPDLWRPDWVAELERETALEGGNGARRAPKTA